MRFTPCTCRAEHYGRIQRSAWMHLFPSRRLYHCLACDTVLFIRPVDAATGSASPTDTEAPGDEDGKERPAA